MYKADSDIIGIIWAILAFGLPLLVSFFENKKKKQRRGRVRRQEVTEEDDMFKGFTITDLFEEPEQIKDESLEGEEFDSRDFEEVIPVQVQEDVVPDQRVEFVVVPQPHSIDGQKDEVLERIKSMAESKYKEKLIENEGKEGDERIKAVDILGEVQQDEAGEICRRVKDNPKDLIIFGEIMNPKYKEY